jgi:hypothetical protein
LFGADVAAAGPNAGLVDVHRYLTATADGRRIVIAIIVALGLRLVLRGGGPGLLAEHWPGPPQGARLLGRFAFGTQANASLASRMP